MKSVGKSLLLAMLLLTIPSCAVVSEPKSGGCSLVYAGPDLMRSLNKKSLEGAYEKVSTWVTEKEIPIVTLCKFTF